MKTVYGTILVSLLLLATGCAQKVNDPADVEAIKNLTTEMDNAENTMDSAWFNSIYYADNAVRLPPHQTMIAGAETIHESIQASFDANSSIQQKASIDEVQSSGDLAVARGKYTWEGTPKASELGKSSDQGKWTAAYQRQADGTWKCIWDIWNSDLPVADTLPIGEEELALLKLEQDWEQAILNADADALGEILADDYIRNQDGQVTTRAQYLTNLRRGIIKAESATQSDRKVIVLGDRAIVQGVTTFQGSDRGRDTSGEYLWTDVYEKRDGRWQCVTGYVSQVQ